MREIKFRQRNKNNGQFHYWGMVDGEWIDPRFTENYSDPGESEQYTGLKDKNGVEIYEGDIVDKGYSNLDTYDCVSAVEWGSGGDSDGYYHGEWQGWITNKNHSLLDVCEVCEVIGNIHENPELLEQNDE